ncbi:hypothetical protein BDQ17DRAFT_340186 [Cyathus striatus]|nr:hypothetical protein BDQ17DRAFT_340186 [Cyathus striatus]
MYRKTDVGSFVSRYLTDFSKAIANEVRILLADVGRLREERQTLTIEVAQLLDIKAKYPGGVPPEWLSKGPEPLADIVPSAVESPPALPVIEEVSVRAHPRWRDVVEREERPKKINASRIAAPTPTRAQMSESPRTEMSGWALWKPPSLYDDTTQKTNGQSLMPKLSKTIANDVRMLLTEVTRLREERQNLVMEVTRLLDLKEKYSNGVPQDWLPKGPEPIAVVAPPAPPAIEEPPIQAPGRRVIHKKVKHPPGSFWNAHGFTMERPTLTDIGVQVNVGGGYVLVAGGVIAMAIAVKPEFGANTPPKALMIEMEVVGKNGTPNRIYRIHLPFEPGVPIKSLQTELSLALLYLSNVGNAETSEPHSSGASARETNYMVTANSEIIPDTYAAGWQSWSFVLYSRKFKKLTSAKSLALLGLICSATLMQSVLNCPSEPHQ